MYRASTLLAVIMEIGIWLLHASPRWLLLCAICCLCALTGEVIGDLAPVQVYEMLDELSYIGDDKEARIVEMVQGKCLKLLPIGAGLVLFQQVSSVIKGIGAL